MPPVLAADGRLLVEDAATGPPLPTFSNWTANRRRETTRLPGVKVCTRGRHIWVSTGCSAAVLGREGKRDWDCPTTNWGAVLVVQSKGRGEQARRHPRYFDAV
jgi:hypothetical protein